jgi:2-polyprenylphenol 6-hydroxylase
MNFQEQSLHQQYDIIIVGAGIVGSTLACKLYMDNPTLRIVILEAVPFSPNYSEKNFDPRVVALTIASQKLLHDIGVWQSIISKRFCPYTHMHVWDGTGTGSIDFDCRDVGEPALGYIVENSVIVESLLEMIQQSDIEFRCPAKVSAINLPLQDQLTLVILEDGSSLRAPLIIATDGANSPIRHMAHLETREWDYGHTAIISTAQTEKSHSYSAQQRFTEQGPLAFLPLETVSDNTNQVNTNYSSVVWSVEKNYARELLSMDDSHFAAALSDAFEHKLGAVKQVTARYSFPLIQRHCKNYFKPGVVVAGDAAHTIHPLAGQGVNLGLQDVAALAHEIQRANERGVAFSDISILQRYQRRRKGPNLAMMGVMEGFKQLFAADTLPLRWLRNAGMTRLDKARLLKNKIIKEAMGL